MYLPPNKIINTDRCRFWISIVFSYIFLASKQTKWSQTIWQLPSHQWIICTTSYVNTEHMGKQTECQKIIICKLNWKLKYGFTWVLALSDIRLNRSTAGTRSNALMLILEMLYLQKRTSNVNKCDFLCKTLENTWAAPYWKSQRPCRSRLQLQGRRLCL